MESHRNGKNAREHRPHVSFFAVAIVDLVYTHYTLHIVKAFFTMRFRYYALISRKQTFFESTTTTTKKKQKDLQSNILKWNSTSSTNEIHIHARFR